MPKKHKLPKEREFKPHKKAKIKVRYALYSILFSVTTTTLLYASGYRQPLELIIYIVLSYLTALCYYVDKKR